jgi:hypothetical protein
LRHQQGDGAEEELVVEGLEDAEAPARGHDLPGRGRGGVGVIQAERDEAEVVYWVPRS